MTLLNKASAVHLGATQVQALYLGATQVWNSSWLPTGPFILVDTNDGDCSPGGNGAYRIGSNNRVWLSLPDPPFYCSSQNITDWVTGATNLLEEPFTYMTFTSPGHSDLVVAPTDIDGSQASAFRSAVLKSWLDQVTPAQVELTINFFYLEWTWTGTGNVSNNIPVGESTSASNVHGKFLFVNNIDLDGLNLLDQNWPNGNPIPGGPVTYLINGIPSEIKRSDQEDSGTWKGTSSFYFQDSGFGDTVIDQIEADGFMRISYPV